MTVQQNPPADPGKDPEVMIRTTIITGIVGYLLGPKVHMDPNLASAVGAALGWLIDHIAFDLKTQ